MVARILLIGAVQFMAHERFKQLFSQDRSGMYGTVYCVYCLSVCKSRDWLVFLLKFIFQKT